MQLRLMLFAVLLSVCGTGYASTPFKQSLTVKNGTYLQDGVFIGGKAGVGSALLGVRRTFSQKVNIERVIVDLGMADAKPAGKKIGYFQASVDAKQNRVILDLAQLRSSSVSEPKLKEIFKNSPYVSSVEFTLDPEDQAGTMVLNLKRPMQLEVFELIDGKKPGRVVMDLTPAKITSLKKSHL